MDFHPVFYPGPDILYRVKVRRIRRLHQGCNSSIRESFFRDVCPVSRGVVILKDWARILLNEFSYKGDNIPYVVPFINSSVMFFPDETTALLPSTDNTPKHLSLRLPFLQGIRLGILIFIYEGSLLPHRVIYCLNLVRKSHEFPVLWIRPQSQLFLIECNTPSSVSIRYWKSSRANNRDIVYIFYGFS